MMFALILAGQISKPVNFLSVIEAFDEMPKVRCSWYQDFAIVPKGRGPTRDARREARRPGRINRRTSPGYPKRVIRGIGFVSSEMLDL